MTLFSGNSMWYLIRQSDGMSMSVLFVLLGMSVACWTIFLYKMFFFMYRKRQLQAAIRELQHVTTVEQVQQVAATRPGSLPSRYMYRNLAFLKELVNERASQATPDRQREWDCMERGVEQTLDDVITLEESSIPVLATSAAVAPLLGLFGTVWGLVHAFMGISKHQTVDISAVAPGISQALMTTLAGLMVAIPALVMYNVLQVQLRSIEHLLMRIGERVSGVARKTLA